MATEQGQGERKTMRGWAHSAPGRPETVLKLRNDLPYPSVVGPTEVLVAISHAALNPGASIFTTLLPMFMRTKPSIPDMDFAGKIVSVGADVLTSRDLKAGTRVFGSVPVPQYVGKARGSMAEFVVVPAENVCATPDNLPAEQAAGLGIAGCSAVTVLEAAKLKAGDRVLINGASGGVGSLTVQIVRNAIGTTGHIVAICSGRNVEMVKALGADEIIDYTTVPVIHTHLASLCGDDKFDAVIDCHGSQDLLHHCAEYLKKGRPYVAVGVAATSITWGGLLLAVGQLLSNALWPAILGGVKRPYISIAAFAGRPQMEELAALVKEDKLKVPLDSVWEMEDALKAYERILGGHARGKVIVKVKSNAE